MTQETNTSQIENPKRNLFGTPIGELGVSHAVELHTGERPRREIMYDADPTSMRAPEPVEQDPYAAELRSEAGALMRTPIPVEFVDQASQVSVPVTVR